jgi:PTS system mannose-specific IIC component
MSIIQAMLLGGYYWFANSTLFPGGFYTIYRPLIAGLFTGIVLGDPVTGAMVGATINLMYIGFIGAGGALPADMCLAGIVGTALAITAGLTTEVALAIAVPVGLLGTLIWFGRMTLCTIWVRFAERFIEKEQPEKLWIADALLPQTMLFFMTAIPCFIIVYLGAYHIEGVLAVLGANVVGVLATVGFMMPALGMGLVLVFIFKGESRVFFFLGFLLAVYFGLSLIAVGLFALCAAVLYTQLKNAKGGAENV